jgi:hypothetical protein
MQVPFAAIVPFEKEIVPAPGTGENTGVPHPEVDAPAGSATTMADGEVGGVGNVSVKFSPESIAPFGLLIVKESLETPPAEVVVGVNALDIVTVVGSIIFAMRAPTL